MRKSHLCSRLWLGIVEFFAKILSVATSSVLEMPPWSLYFHTMQRRSQCKARLRRRARPAAVRNANTVHMPGHCRVSSDRVRMSDEQALDWAARWGPVGWSTSCGFSSWCVSLQLSFSGTRWLSAQLMRECCAVDLGKWKKKMCIAKDR